MDLLMEVLMAEQKTGGWSRRGLGSIRTAWLPFTLLGALCLARALGAADAVPANSTTANPVTAPLAYEETDSSVISWGLSLNTQTASFLKEPTAAPGKTVRGGLNLGDNSSNSIPFLWQRDAKKLFLDMNRNRDLTDDPAGVFSAQLVSSISYQSFTNVHLPFNTAAGRSRVLVDLNLYDYSTQPSGIIRVRSFWQGRAALNGRDWQVGIVQNDLNQSGSFENGQLLLRPWEARNRPFTTSDGTLATVQFSRKLFLDGHAYQLDLTAQSENGEAKPALRFTEQFIALGELKIIGKFIQRLVLTGGSHLVVLDEPASTVKVPVGSYAQPKILLAQGGIEAFFNSNEPNSVSRISVSDKAPAVLDAGGPLTNSVIAIREGQDLRLDYKLIGADGATYQLVKRDTSKPPEFAVFKGDRKIASGKFEFG
jgi:hypothetical protein